MTIRKVKKQLKKFIDKKATPLGDMSVVTWVYDFKPTLDFKFNKLGFYYDNSNDTYTNGVLTFKGTTTPWHIGYNKNGDLRFRNAKVYKVKRV